MNMEQGTDTRPSLGGTWDQSVRQEVTSYTLREQND